MSTALAVHVSTECWAQDVLEYLTSCERLQVFGITKGLQSFRLLASLQVRNAYHMMVLVRSQSVDGTL